MFTHGKRGGNVPRVLLRVRGSGEDAGLRVFEFFFDLYETADVDVGDRRDLVFVFYGRFVENPYRKKACFRRDGYSDVAVFDYGAFGRDSAEFFGCREIYRGVVFAFGNVVG